MVGMSYSAARIRRTRMTERRVRSIKQSFRFLSSARPRWLLALIRLLCWIQHLIYVRNVCWVPYPDSTCIYIGIECVYAFCAFAQKQKLFCSARNKRHWPAWDGQYIHLYMANYRNCDVWIRIISLLIVSTYTGTHSRRRLPSRWVEMART